MHEKHTRSLLLYFKISFSETNSDIKYNVSSLLFYFQKHLFAAGMKYRLRSSYYQPADNMEKGESVPAHSRGAGTRWSLKSLPNKNILCLYDNRMIFIRDAFSISAETSNQLQWEKFLTALFTPILLPSPKDLLDFHYSVWNISYPTLLRS